MNTEISAWLAQLIRSEQESLIQATVAVVRATVPEYDQLPDVALRAIFGQAYTVFAISLETDDLTPWRNYLQVALVERARVGIAPAGMIPTIEIVQLQVLALAERQQAADRTTISASRSILRSWANRIRLLIGELNLAQINSPPPPADPPRK